MTSTPTKPATIVVPVKERKPGRVREIESCPLHWTRAKIGQWMGRVTVQCAGQHTNQGRAPNERPQTRRIAGAGMIGQRGE